MNGEKLKRLRKEAGLTQIVLADLVDVSRRAIISWELDERTPSSDKIQKLAAALHVTADELLKGE